MNRNFQKPTPTPTRLDSRQRYRHDRDQNPLHNLHGQLPSYRAQADFDNSAVREPLNEQVPSGELSYEEQYRTDGEAHNYKFRLDEDRFGEYPRYGKNMNRAQPRKNFTGVGPKGYKRSDERIEEEVCERLAADRYIDASDILVSVENAVVKLSGNVEDREDRTAAEMLVENVWGIEDIINDIKVKKKYH